jgi:hypothetical protein
MRGNPIAMTGGMLLIVGALVLVAVLLGHPAGNPAAAQTGIICIDPPQPAFVYFDTNQDDILDLQELQEVAEALGDEEFQARVEQFIVAGAEGIQYQNCTPPGASPTIASPTVATPAVATNGSDQ